MQSWWWGSDVIELRDLSTFLCLPCEQQREGGRLQDLSPETELMASWNFKPSEAKQEIKLLLFKSSVYYVMATPVDPYTLQRDSRIICPWFKKFVIFFQEWNHTILVYYIISS